MFSSVYFVSDVIFDLFISDMYFLCGSKGLEGLKQAFTDRMNVISYENVLEFR